MSQIPMTNSDRINVLEQLGYSEREAAFLNLAALHGGYFLRRQYCEFLGKEVGGTAASLIEKIFALKHAKVSTFEHNTRVYHLCTRLFYAALGQADNRNRRERQPLTVKNKLMGLDFVLAHRECQFLATEQEKVDYFTGTLHIAHGKLPAKRYRSQETRSTTIRYFVDKYPIFLASASPDGSTVSFCFVDEGLTTASRFETYLEQYTPLFGSLGRFHVIYVGATVAPFRWAEPTFERYLAKFYPRNGRPIDPSMTRMLAYFEMRQQFEAKELTSFDRTKLIRLRNEREEFAGEPYDSLFERWKSGGQAAVREVLAPERSTELEATFSTYLLRQNYDLFGSLTAFSRAF